MQSQQCNSHKYVQTTNKCAYAIRKKLPELLQTTTSKLVAW